MTQPYNTIIIKNYNNNFEEEPAGEAITPGHLVELTTAGLVRPHSTADGAAAKKFAIEDALQGKTIDEAYAIGDPVRFLNVVPGDEINALILDGEDIAISDKLVSAGNGRLKEREGASDAEIPGSIVATALEALDLTGSSGADTTYRCRVSID